MEATRRYGPLVPVASLQWMLSISQTRVSALVNEQRFTLLMPPDGRKFDRFVPLEELFEAPFLGEIGRKGVFGPENRSEFGWLEDFFPGGKPLEYGDLEQTG